jgi:DNA-binding winged helix-turn-helix (wHTH) protein
VGSVKTVLSGQLRISSQIPKIGIPRKTKVLYEFGKFRCDPREHLLLCEGKPVSLAPKSFEILVVLIQNHGRLLTKDELMHLAWPDSFVEEGNLTVNISALRKVLGETTDGQQYIETVPKRGYRFVAPVREASSTSAPAEPRDGLTTAAPQAPSPARARNWWLMAVAIAHPRARGFGAHISGRDQAH